MQITVRTPPMARYVGLRKGIRNALNSCMKPFNNPINGRYYEPDYVAGIVNALPACLKARSKNWNLQFASCFIHQSPMISYCNADGKTSRCELGDLLIVCHDCAEDRYNSALLQMKMEGHHGWALTPDQNQLYVYTNWPLITMRNKSYCIQPKTVSQGALYGVVHPQSCNGMTVGVNVSISSASRSIPFKGQKFEDFLYNLIEFRSGRSFVDTDRAVTCDDWSYLINDLLCHVKTALYSRRNIRQYRTNRVCGDFFSFLCSQNNCQGGNIEDHADHNEDGHFGVLWVECVGGYNL